MCLLTNNVGDHIPNIHLSFFSLEHVLVQEICMQIIVVLLPVTF